MRSRFLPLAAAAALVVASRCATVGPMSATVAQPDGVRFQVTAPAAERVSVAGTFNGWSPTAHPLRREGGAPGRWTTVVRLPAGEHQYMFVVDGREWMAPPLADAYADDGFGARNGVVIVRDVQGAR
jgi:1,4-alpha-glucan branching enzyme